MRLSKIANLVILRNHLQTVCNNTAVVKKADYRNVTSLISNLDDKIIKGALNLDLEDVMSEFDCLCENTKTQTKSKSKETKPKETKAVKSGLIKTGQMELPFSKTETMSEIQKRIEEEKKSLDK
jgi:hypothetical protein